MSLNQRIVKAVYLAIDDVNNRRAKDELVVKSTDTALFGPQSSLDSLGFVNMIVAVEKRIEEEFGTVVTLATEEAMSQKNNPFQTVGTLVDYISTLLDKQQTTRMKINE